MEDGSRRPPDRVDGSGGDDTHMNGNDDEDQGRKTENRGVTS